MLGLITAVGIVTFVAFDQPAGTKLWHFYTGTSIQSSVAVGAHGQIYFGTDSGKLYCFYGNGRGMWEYPTRDRIVGSPAVAADGTIYFGSYDANLYAMAPEGIERWRFQADGPVACSPAIGPNGMIIFGSLNKRLFAVRSDGSKAWDIKLSSQVVASPAVAADGTVYAPTVDGVVTALSGYDGSVKWEFEAPNRVVSSPAIGQDGTIYFGCFDGHLYAMTPAGKKKWTYATGGPISSSPAIGPDGTIYFGSDDRQLYALAPDGFKKWTFTCGKWIRSTPTIAADGTVYIGSYDQSFYAIGPNGAKKWEFVTDGKVTASAALSADGDVYIGSWDGHMYAIRGSSPLASGVWPRFRGGVRQAGRVSPTMRPPAVSSSTETLVAKTTPPVAAERKVAETKPRKRSSDGRSWWTRVFGGSGKTKRSERPLQVAQKVETVTPSEVVVTRTNTLSGEKEQAYQARMAAMEQRMTKLNSELAEARRPQDPPPTAAPAASVGIKMGNATIIADSATLVRGGSAARVPAPEPILTMTNYVDVESPQEVAYRQKIAAMEQRVAELSVEVEKTRTVRPAPMTRESTAVTMVQTRSVTSVPAGTPMGADGRIPMMSLRGASLPAPEPVAAPVVTAPVVSPEPTRVVAPVRTDISAEIDAVWGEEKKTKTKRGWFNWFGTGKSDEPASRAPAAQPKPSADPAAREREIQDMKRISALEGRIEELNGELAAANRPQEVESIPAPTAVMDLPEPGETRIIADSSQLNLVHSAAVEVPKEERPGFFKHLFSRGSRSEPKNEVSSASEIESNPAIVSVKTVSEEAAVTGAPSKMVDTEADRMVGAKLTAMEDQLKAMRTELDSTRQERDELRRQLAAESSAEGDASRPVSRSEPGREESKKIGGYERISGDGGSGQLGDKISRLESQLLSLSEELGNARVERVRLREELARVREGGSSVVRVAPAEPATVASRVPEATTVSTKPAMNTVSTAVPAAPRSSTPSSEAASVTSPPTGTPGGWSREEFVNPAAFAGMIPESRSRAGRAEAPAPTVATVSAASPANVQAVSQPAWLSNEVRSVISAGDPWSLPPGTTTPAITQTASTSIDMARSPASNPRTAAALTKPVVVQEEEEKPGFFRRLFGLGAKSKKKKTKSDVTTFKATNIVVAPSPAPIDGSTLTDAQLRGMNLTALAHTFQKTNFPPVKFEGVVTNGSQTPPAFAELSHLPGFPKTKPVIIPPPVRAMNPQSTSHVGLRTVDVTESVTKVGTRTLFPTAAPVSRPSVFLVSPPDKAVLDSPVLDLRGTAQSSRRVAQVMVSINGAPFVPAAGLENWSYQAPVKSGLILVRVKAMDADGRESEIVTHSYSHQSKSALKLDVAGKGWIVPDLNGRELELGQAYQIVAQPAPGHEFVRWSGGVESTSPRLQFQMNNNLWIRAEFRPTPANLSGGQFVGLIYPRDVLSADKCGYFELSVADDGAFTGAIQLDGSTAQLKGQFDREGEATQTLASADGEPVTIRLQMDADRTGESVSGAFEANGSPVVMQAYRRAAGDASTTGIKPGRYTLVIPGPTDAKASPGGDGIGELHVHADGRAEFYGELSDGTAVRQQTHISRNGVWPLYVPMYGGRGLLTGWVTVTNHAEMDLFGDLRWIKPRTPDDHYYPEGFGSRRFVVGSSYSAQAALNATNRLAGVLRGGNLGSIVLRDNMNSDTQLIAPEGRTVKKFSYNLNPDTGLIEGSFIHPQTHTPTPFRGVYVQKRGWGSGYFMGTNTSGMVHLQLQ